VFVFTAMFHGLTWSHDTWVVVVVSCQLKILSCGIYEQLEN